MSQPEQPTSVCYLCGHRGKAEPVQTLSANTSVPFFPWLRAANAAPGSLNPNPATGEVFLCFLCSQLMTLQWKNYEKRKTPLAQRQYWWKACCSDLNNCCFAPERHSDEFPSNARDIASPDTGADVTQQSSPAVRSCVLCSKNIGTDPECENFRLVACSMLKKIFPDFVQPAGRDLSTTAKDCEVCSECFETPRFQESLKHTSEFSKDSWHEQCNLVTSEKDPSSTMSEQTAYFYQMIMQQLALLQEQSSSSSPAAASGLLRQMKSCLDSLPKVGTSDLKQNSS